MKISASLLSAAASLAVLAGSSATIARADTITNVALPFAPCATCDIPSGNWSDAGNGPTLAAAPKTGNTGTGLNFGLWSGQFVEVDRGTSKIFAIPSIALNANSVVNALFNSFYGSANSLEGSITFGNSLGGFATYDLVGNQTIRDYNGASTITGSDAFPYNINPVTTQMWFTNGLGQRLDASTFLLPASWNGTNLISMTIVDPLGSGGDAVISALQVDAIGNGAGVAPEPSSLILLGTGALSLAAATRRRWNLAKS